MVMENFAKQMIEFQKATFDNSFDAAVTLQDQAEQLFNTSIEQASWMPEEGRRMVDEWVKMYKSGRDGFKTAVDESFDKLAAYWVNFEFSAALWETKEPEVTKPVKPVKPTKPATTVKVDK